MTLQDKIDTVQGYFASATKPVPSEDAVRSALQAAGGDMKEAVRSLSGSGDTMAIIEGVTRRRDAVERGAAGSEVVVCTTWDATAPSAVRGAILVTVPSGARRVVEVAVSRGVAAVLPHPVVAFLDSEWRSLAAVPGCALSSAGCAGEWAVLRPLAPLPSVPAGAAFLALRGTDALATGALRRTERGFERVPGAGVSVAFEREMKISPCE